VESFCPNMVALFFSINDGEPVFFSHMDDGMTLYIAYIRLYLNKI